MYGSHHNSNAFDFESGSAHAGYTVIEADYCMDPNIEIDALRHQLITLNGQLGRIDGRFDYSGIIAKFDDAPEDQVLLGKMRRQVERMQHDFSNARSNHDSNIQNCKHCASDDFVSRLAEIRLLAH